MWSTRSSAVSGSPAHEGDTAWVTGRWSWAGSSNGPGRPRMAAPDHRRGRGRRAGAEPPVGDGDHGHGDEKPGPVASSTSDAAGRDAKHASVRSVVSVLMRFV